MEKRDILESLINHYTGGNKARFASKIGVKPQTINTWIARNTFDVDVIYANCEDVSGDFLLTGEGDMIKRAEVYPSARHVQVELIQLCKKLVDNYHQRDEAMSQLAALVSKLEA